jgi:hypothetical protein
MSEKRKTRRFIPTIVAALPGLISPPATALGLLGICASLTPSVAQQESLSTPASVAAQPDSGDLVLQLDRLLAEKNRGEADVVYERLLESPADAVAAGLELFSRDGATSELTASYLCSLASEDVPMETCGSLLDHVLASPSLNDWTKRHCIIGLSDHVDGSFREPFLRFAADPERNPNLRVAALKAATSRWPLETRPALVRLLQSAEDPILHHKALQYLAARGDPEDLPLIERFVLNRDPATAGQTLAKEYGLLILRSRREEGVIPLLDWILRDESWPSEIQDRVIDLLAHSDLRGGREALVDVRPHASSKFRSRIDAALAGRE